MDSLLDQAKDLEDRVTLFLALCFIVVQIALIAGSMWLGAELEAGHQARELVTLQKTADSLQLRLDTLEVTATELRCTLMPRAPGC